VYEPNVCSECELINSYLFVYAYRTVGLYSECNIYLISDDYFVKASRFVLWSISMNKSRLPLFCSHDVILLGRGYMQNKTQDTCVLCFMFCVTI